MNSMTPWNNETNREKAISIVRKISKKSEASLKLFKDELFNKINFTLISIKTWR